MTRSRLCHFSALTAPTEHSTFAVVQWEGRGGLRVWTAGLKWFPPTPGGLNLSRTVFSELDIDQGSVDGRVAWLLRRSAALAMSN